MSEPTPNYSPERPEIVDPLGDLEEQQENQTAKNRAKVGSGRPSTLIYSYGPGAIMDLPQFTVMPTGLDDWDNIWRRRQGGQPRKIEAPRLREAVARALGNRDLMLVGYPWQPSTRSRSNEGVDLGIPTRVFPQWLRCTKCNLLAPLDQFDYINTHPYRTDVARFEHGRCQSRTQSSGPSTAGKKKRSPLAVPARYLIACAKGHLDEFPYVAWVHRGKPCPEATTPKLKLVDRAAGRGASAEIICGSCHTKRTMQEAQGERGQKKLPFCRGRHPHLGVFDKEECQAQSKLMLVGASNLWFAATQSIIVMPEDSAKLEQETIVEIRNVLGTNLATVAAAGAKIARLTLEGKVKDLPSDNEKLSELLARAQDEPENAKSSSEDMEQVWDSVDLLVPEWRYLQRTPQEPRTIDVQSGFTVASRRLNAELKALQISRVLAVERLRKVNALLGFTRIDDLDRAGDMSRLVSLSRKRPEYTVATEDRGEGVFIQFDEAAVSAWERRIEKSLVWESHTAAHKRNFENRYSETSALTDHTMRFQPPRYWLLHTIAHVLMREMSLYCGYSAPSLSERIYAWAQSDERPASAGILISTSAADSDGTLGGLVDLSRPELLTGLFQTAVHKASRCSSDPVCANRLPQDPEDFLHGAACHVCAMASETSCERANRFLDRRFLVNLPKMGPNSEALGFFGEPRP